MKYTGLYAVVLVLHLLTVAFLVGPAAVAAVLSPRHVRAGRAEALHDAARTTRVYTMASLLAVLLGAALVGISGGSSGAPQWSNGQTWVLASYGLWLAAVTVVLVEVAPTQHRAALALRAGEDAGPMAGRIALGGGLAMACWTAIVVLMVVKPGA